MQGGFSYEFLYFFQIFCACMKSTRNNILGAEVIQHLIGRQEPNRSTHTRRLLVPPCRSESIAANTSRLSLLDLIGDIHIVLRLSGCCGSLSGTPDVPLLLSCLHHALPMPRSLKLAWQPIHCHLRIFWMHLAYPIALR
jgi:hypothetical protein